MKLNRHPSSTSQISTKCPIRENGISTSPETKVLSDAMMLIYRWSNASNQRENERGNRIEIDIASRIDVERENDDVVSESGKEIDFDDGG